MPYFHCNRCHHEWEGTKDDKMCSWCNDKGYIEDGYVCRAILLALESKPIDIPIDIGTGKGTSILELAKMFGGTFTFNSESDTIGLKSNIAKIEDAKKYISFEAVHTVESYVNAMKSLTWEDIYRLNL